ncbi:MAG: phosphate ABC transporter permease [Elusimicrobia bacterium RIFOXYA12_FULL_51_18]|nr:MAG: phosphate ABC transporter permease [Elusimicrobia bacterium RIFOXYA12_FULL_51_18]OGS28328.1 MAG: phosphate ABC transporter permease [Elusimicrobia bacterium RIFOXYA2_FULL_53_38]
MTDKNEITIIKPAEGLLAFDFRELSRYSELFYFLAKRDIKVRYKQTVLGGLWAIIQPAFAMIVFSVFLGRMAHMPSDNVPYPVFVYAGLLAWTYFANALAAAGESMVSNANLITKVYFPRLIVPAAAALAGLLDFFIASFLLAAMMLWYGIYPGAAVLLFPVLIGLTFFCAIGAGLWLAALNVEYRDIRYVIPFLIQLWMFASPVIYPSSIVPARYQWLIAVNPMAGVIKAFRACLLGTQPVDWVSLGVSSAVIILLLVSGLFYFRRMERTFADVV